MELEPTELSKAIEAVRGELAAARQEGNGSGIRFEIETVVLDFGLELRNTVSASGGIKAFVVSTDAKGEHAKTATHRMTVTLRVAPDGTGRPLQIGDRSGRRLEPLPRQSS